MDERGVDGVLPSCSLADFAKLHALLLLLLLLLLPRRDGAGSEGREPEPAAWLAGLLPARLAPLRLVSGITHVHLHKSEVACTS